MKLLDPKEIRSDRNETIEQSSARAQKLAKEETRLALYINILREEADKEAIGIHDDLENYKKEKASERAKLNDEISVLEQKRKKLLEPIDGMYKEIKALNLKIEKRNADLDREKEVVEKDREEVKKNQHELNKKETEIKEQRIWIEFEKTCIQQEKINLESHKKSLSEEHQQNVLKAEENTCKSSELAKKEESLKLTEKILADRDETQHQRAHELIGEAKRLKSERQAIEQAKIHLGIKI
jgi:hypothetical protein